MRKSSYLALSISAVLLSACATQGPESVKVEKKKGVTLIHHRRRTQDGAVDRIEAISPSGAYSSAEVKVYDIGRYVDSSGNVHDAHRVYRVEQSAHPNLMVSKAKVTSGPKSAALPANYVPTPEDQRINDAVTQAAQARQKFEQATKDLETRVKEDNNLRGQLSDEMEQNQKLRDQLNAGMSVSKTNPGAQSEAEKAAQAAADGLATWGKNAAQ
jgi:hypothetical protein